MNIYYHGIIKYKVNQSTVYLLVIDWGGRKCGW